MKNPSIFVFLKKPLKDKEKFVNSIISHISYSKENGYAGHVSKNALKQFLTWAIYGTKQKELWKSINVKDVKQVIKDTMIRYKSVINKNITIFVFPTIAQFVIEKMDGISGFTPWKNTIIININPSKKWQNALKDTIGHELAHALALNFNERRTIGDNLVFEGIAEHFKEDFINKNKSKWVKSISKEEALQILEEIKSKLGMENEKFYKDLFFGTGKYPLWAGYAIGYYIIDNYLKKKKIDWNKLIKTKPKEIINDENT